MKEQGVIRFIGTRPDASPSGNLQGGSRSRERLGQDGGRVGAAGSRSTRSASGRDVGPPLTGSLRSQEDLVSMPLRKEVNTTPLHCKCQTYRGMEN